MTRFGAGRAAALGLGLAIIAIGAGPAGAADWIITLGERTSVVPPYEGANHDVLSPSLLFNARKAGSLYRFTPPDTGSNLTLSSHRYFDFGLALRFRYARGNSGKLAGMDKIGAAGEPGVFVDFWPTNWLRARVEGRRGVFGHEGYVGWTGFDVIHTGKTWDFSIGPRLGWGGAKYMETYFGVTPEEAAASPLIKTPYTPGAGERYRGVETAASYHLTKRWRTWVDFSYHRLSSRAADSPVVGTAGSRDQYAGSLGFSYEFGVHLGHRR
ncbi:MAG: MipA/OmpV family protein [Caulobacteraceae bacterium]